MRRFAPQHIPKTISLPLACSLTLLTLAILPSPLPESAVGFRPVSILAAPIALAAVELQERTHERLPAPSGTRVIPIETPVAIVVPVAAIVVPKEIVIPKDVQKIQEARLLIPDIGVDAAIKALGTAPDGSMSVPANRFDASWFSLGTRPGDIGSAVIAGHNRWTDGAGVFEHLDRLAVGDVLSVVDAKGVSTSFVVRSMRTFDADELHSGIFESESGAHLNLITCSGTWNASQKDYTTRLVVYTDLIPSPAP